MAHGKGARNQNHADQKQRTRKFGLQPDLMFLRAKAGLFQLSDEVWQIINGDRRGAADALTDPVKGQRGGDHQRFMGRCVTLSIDLGTQWPDLCVAQGPFATRECCTACLDPLNRAVGCVIGNEGHIIEHGGIRI